jgi:vitamin B12 transporter
MPRALAALPASAMLAGAALIPLAARAQEAVDAVVVTATRLPAPLDLTPGAHVIDEAAIERRQSPFVTDILSTVPGVTISEAGPFGGVSSLSLRGASSDKTLVLVDGVPVNDPSAPAGGFDFSSLDAAGLARIEVLNGPQSALWGSDAIGGVVAITTREPSGVSAFGEGGSLATIREGFAVGRAEDRWALGLSAANFRTAGVSKADEKFGNTEPDGFNNTTIGVNGRLALAEGVTLDARVRGNWAGTEYDAGVGGPGGVTDSNDTSDIRTVSGDVRLAVRGLLGLDQEVRLDVLDLDRQYHGAFPFGAVGGRQALRWSAERRETGWGAAFGVDLKAESENTGDGRQARDAAGAWAIGRLTPARGLDLTASVREDAPQGYASQATGRLAAAWAMGAGFTLKASAGQGYKAPSLFETTYPCPECTVPGPARNLKAERAEGWDAGIAWRSPDGRLRVEAAGFGLRVRDQIDYVDGFGYLNVEKVRSSGLEAAAEARLPAGVSVSGSFTHEDAVDALTGARRPRIPRESGTVSVGWRGQGLTLDGGVRAQDAAPDLLGTIRPYAIAYLAGAYALSPHLTFTARVENLAGSHYEEAFGYGEPGRMVLVGLKWRD